MRRAYLAIQSGGSTSLQIYAWSQASEPQKQERRRSAGESKGFRALLKDPAVRRPLYMALALMALQQLGAAESWYVMLWYPPGTAPDHCMRGGVSTGGRDAVVEFLQDIGSPRRVEVHHVRSACEFSAARASFRDLDGRKLEGILSELFS